MTRSGLSRSSSDGSRREQDRQDRCPACRGRSLAPACTSGQNSEARNAFGKATVPPACSAVHDRPPGVAVEERRDRQDGVVAARCRAARGSAAPPRRCCRGGRARPSACRSCPTCRAASSGRSGAERARRAGCRGCARAGRRARSVGAPAPNAATRAAAAAARASASSMALDAARVGDDHARLGVPEDVAAARCAPSAGLIGWRMAPALSTPNAATRYSTELPSASVTRSPFSHAERCAARARRGCVSAVELAVRHAPAVVQDEGAVTTLSDMAARTSRMSMRDS